MAVAWGGAVREKRLRREGVRVRLGALCARGGALRSLVVARGAWRRVLRKRRRWLVSKVVVVGSALSVLPLRFGSELRSLSV